MLAEIREALGRRSDDSPSSEATASVLPRAAGPARDEMVTQFCAELEKVGGHSIRVRSAEEIRHYIEELLPEAQPSQAEHGQGADDSGERAQGADKSGVPTAP